MATTGDARVLPVLKALAEGRLYYRKPDRLVVLADKDGRRLVLTDPLTDDALGTVKKRRVRKAKVNNKLRRQIRALMGSMTLLSKDPRVRLEEAKTIFKSRDVSAINILEIAIADETVTVVREALLQARAAAVLNSDRDKSEKLPALKIMEDRGDQDALAVVNLVAQTASGKL